MCVCAADDSALNEEGNCVIPNADSEDCKRRAKIGGVMTCIKDARCNDYNEAYKLADDNYGYTCVSTCSTEKFEEDENTKELRCVEDCAHWWYRAEDGLCKEQKWRKNTAIAVPIVVVIAIVAVVVVFVVGKKCKGDKKNRRKQPIESRDNVVGGDA